MNVITIAGNVGQDAELKVLTNGSSVLKFSLATSEKWKDKTTGEAKEKTEWHRCVYFSKGAEKLAQYITKGTKLAVQGAMSYGSYEKDGTKVYTADVKVNNITFMGSKGERSAVSEESDDSDTVLKVDSSDIPF